MNKQRMYCGKPKGDMNNIYRRWFYKWIIRTYLKDCKTIIDIGTGTGLFYDVAKGLGKDITGIDLDERNIRDNIILQDYKNINKKYHCFWNSQFIEHIDQFKFIQIAQRFCMKVLITITNKPCNSFWDVPDHIRPYTIKAIQRLYINHGFKPIFSMNLYPTKSFIVIGLRKLQT